MLGLALRAPGYTISEVNDWIDGQNLSSERLVPQSRALAPIALTGRFEWLVFVIPGTEDFTTPTSIVRAFVDGVDAAHKGLWRPISMNSSEFLKEMRALLVARH